MEYVNLGATGMRVSRVCLGMMSFGNNSERPWVLARTRRNRSSGRRSTAA